MNLLIGTQSGLILTDSEARQNKQWLIQDEWISSLSLDETRPELLITCRSGKIFKFTSTGISFVDSVCFRPWFARRLPNGDILVGGTSRHLATLQDGCASKVTYSSEPIQPRSWHSHSGGPAHLHTIASTRHFGEIICGEVGGVLHRSAGTWSALGRNIDPDVHSIVEDNCGRLLATTGSGLFSLEPDNNIWARIPGPPIHYLQGIVSTASGDIVVTGSRTPFGRRLGGQYRGWAPGNFFGVFRYDGESWRRVPGTDSFAGVLSKGITTVGDQLVAGDLTGRVFQGDPRNGLNVVASGLGHIECLATIKPLTV